MTTQDHWPDHWRPLDHDPAAVINARHRRDWSQRRLAAEIGKSQPYIAQIEAGTRNANPALLLALAKALRCSVSSLEHKQRRGPKAA